jgi:DNA-binding transcriptional regulator PaaX
MDKILEHVNQLAVSDSIDMIALSECIGVSTTIIETFLMKLVAEGTLYCEGGTYWRTMENDDCASTKDEFRMKFHKQERRCDSQDKIIIMLEATTERLRRDLREALTKNSALENRAEEHTAAEQASAARSESQTEEISRLVDQRKSLTDTCVSLEPYKSRVQGYNITIGLLIIIIVMNACFMGYLYQTR